VLNVDSSGHKMNTQKRHFKTTNKIAAKKDVGVRSTSRGKGKRRRYI